MTKPTCPYLGSFDAKERQRPPVEYPSFENHCQILGSDFLLPLTDQATFCLSSSHTLCHHYQTAQGAMSGAHGALNPVLEFDEFAVNLQQPLQQQKSPLNLNAEKVSPLDETSDDLDDLHEEAWETGSRRRVWAWAGASLLFLSVLLSGAIFAIYSGWEIALRNFAAQPPGQVDTLPGETMAAQPTLFLIVTATSETTPEPSPTTVTAIDTPADPGQSTFPVAVTPTPVLVAFDSSSAVTTTLDATTIQTITVVQTDPVNSPQENNGPATSPGEVAVVPVVSPPLAQITPVIDVLAPVPTRRPTPEFDIPTSTPALDGPTPTPTPAPTLGPPLVIFGPDKKEVFAGQCTHIRWRVENVREVYYENQGVNGVGDREECLRDEPNIYSLTVVLSDGSSKIYTTTIALLIPTETPTPTPTFTEEPEATPTWTVEPATNTPAPNIEYGVSLEINNGNQQRCLAGVECIIGLLTRNTGNAIDNISVEFLQIGRWQALLCRQDGVCAVDKLTLNGINPNNTPYIQLRITIPANTGGQQTSYAFRSISEGSQGAVTSEAVVLEITVE